MAYDAPAPTRRERNAAIVLVGGAAPLVLALVWADGWHVHQPRVVAFLAVAAVVAAVQGIEFGPGLHYDAADPLVILSGILGGPLGGALAGASTVAVYSSGWRSRAGYGATRAAQGAVAGAVVHLLGLGLESTLQALGAAVAAEAAGTVIVFAATSGLAFGGVIELTRTVVLTNLFDPALGAPLVAGLALTYDRAGAGPLALLLVPSLLAATGVRVVRERWKTRHAESEARARRDPLTGAYNRRWFHERIEGAIAAGERVALVLLDLDRFKAVNDAHGHATGDQVLVESVRRLAARVRQGDGVVRWGGDELAVVLRGIGDGADLAARADALRAAIGGEPFLGGEGDIRVTASAGAAWLRGDAESLVRAADVALYAAKDRGRDRSVAGPS